jgi:hypothetical protein
MIPSRGGPFFANAGTGMFLTSRPLAHVAAATLFAALPSVVRAQNAAPPSSNQDITTPAITSGERVEWVTTSIVGPQSLWAGVVVAGTATIATFPPEWGRTASGFGRRYVSRDGAIAVSNGVEASLGALWGEDPRYFQCHCEGIGRRSAHAARLSVLALGADGRVAPAWGRYAGDISGNFAQNAWLPPSGRTWQQMVLRQAGAIGGRFVGNLWTEFWPDVRRRFRH